MWLAAFRLLKMFKKKYLIQQTCGTKQINVIIEIKITGEKGHGCRFDYGGVEGVFGATCEAIRLLID